MAAKKSVKKSARKSGSNVPMAPQPHGGALRVGSLPGNTPGTGRPPSAVKQLAAQKLPKHVDTLDQIADGIITVQLTETCPKCGHKGDVTKLPMECKPGERVRAIEALAKLAEQKEIVITNDNAAGFFDCVHKAVTELYGETAAAQVKLRAIQLLEAKA